MVVSSFVWRPEETLNQELDGKDRGEDPGDQGVLRLSCLFMFRQAKSIADQNISCCMNYFGSGWAFKLNLLLVCARQMIAGIAIAISSNAIPQVLSEAVVTIIMLLDRMAARQHYGQ